MNRKCRAYAHFVYTVAMRCVLCRCDLIAARSVEVANPIAPREPNPASELSIKSARAQAAR